MDKPSRSKTTDGLVLFAIVAAAMAYQFGKYSRPPAPSGTPPQVAAYPIQGGSVPIPPVMRGIVASASWSMPDASTFEVTRVLLRPTSVYPVDDSRAATLGFACGYAPTRAMPTLVLEDYEPDGTLYSRQVVHPAEDCR